MPIIADSKIKLSLWSSFITLELKDVINFPGYADDKVRFRDLMEGLVYEAIITAEGQGSIIIKGESYSLSYHDDKNALDEEHIVINGKNVREDEIVILEDVDNTFILDVSGVDIISCKNIGIRK